MTDYYRPKRLDIENREVYMTLDSETSFRAINANGNPQLIGRARIGTSESTPQWQIMRLNYDANGSITSIQWPISPVGCASSEYKFTWGPSNDAAITGIDLGTTTKIYAANNYSAGDKVYIDGVKGTTGVNYDGTNLYTVSSPTAGNFLINCDSSAMNAYTSGGAAHKSIAMQNGFA